MKRETTKICNFFVTFLLIMINRNVSSNSFEKLKQSNDALISFNELATKSFITLQKDFKKHIKMIKEMKKDLEYIHQKIQYIHFLLQIVFLQV